MMYELVLFSSLSQSTSARIVGQTSRINTRSWMPKLLIPVHNPRDARSDLLIAKDIATPGGSITAFTVTEDDRQELTKKMEDLMENLSRRKGLL